MEKKKLSKKFEKLFNKYEDDELKVILEEELIKNIKYYKSSLEAKEILNQFNLPYYGINKYHHYLLKQLSLLCEKYHIYVDDNNIEVTHNDLIERIKENLAIQIKLYERYEYAVNTNLKEQKDPNTLNNEELYNIYHSIIEKIKEDNDKVLVKKYE